MTVSSVLLVCQFGQPVRGVSPYCNKLFDALQAIEDLKVCSIDYRAAYPGMMHPADSSNAFKSTGNLHWGNPLSWHRVAAMDADIIHLQHWLAPMACYLAPLAKMAKRRGKRIVVTVHNPCPHEALHWTEKFERSLVMQADAIIVHNVRGADVLCARFGIAPDRIHVIPHGICASLSPAPAEAGDHALLGLDPSRHHVCMFGNLRGYKGIDTLISAWRKVVTKLPDVDLVIAGRLWSGKTGIGSRLTARLLGTYNDADRLHAALALPELSNRVHLLEGFQSDENINALIRLSKFAVFPYVRFNSQSGAACRAAGLGCPVLVTNVGGLPDLAIDTSWIIPPGDSDMLASALLEKLSSSLDFYVMRKAQLKRIHAYVWPEVASAHAALYRQLI